MAFSLDDILGISGAPASDSVDSGSEAASSGISLDDVASSFLGSLASAAGTSLGTKSQNGAPSPDIAAKAATPSGVKATSILAGASLPILIVGGGVIAYLLLKK